MQEYILPQTIFRYAYYSYIFSALSNNLSKTSLIGISLMIGIILATVIYFKKMLFVSKLTIMNIYIGVLLGFMIGGIIIDLLNGFNNINFIISGIIFVTIGNILLKVMIALFC